jgi:3-phenylpropionate/trans-cinnamate dioxygenase ferredoxin reductase subunit
VPELNRIVIVGAGLAGAKAAETLRAEGYDGEVVLVGDEGELPYERPPLSKAYLRDETAIAQAHVHSIPWYVEHEVELLTGTAAVRLAIGERRVELADGRMLAYDRLLLTTGAEPRQLELPGAELDGVHTLRTRADADALRARIAAGGPVVVVGGGWIGCEVAASARQLGAEVTLLEAGDIPLGRVLGAEIGEHLAAVHRARGVDLRTGAVLERLEGDGAVAAVVLTDGTRLPAATVVVGIGVRPRAELAARVGLAGADGVEVDERLRTRATDVYAAGDVAFAWNARYGRAIRVEHWANAIAQGSAAARSILGRTAPFDELPYFFSDQFETGLEYVGLHSPSDRTTLRRDGAALTALWTDRAGTVTAGMHVDDWDAIGALRRLAGTTPDPQALADPSVSLDELADSVDERTAAS